ncbi:MAG TPA: phage holin family protein [Roseiarcus sp.]|jgi:predicted neutral ceramidase superfamily lipid hydrolase
MRNDIVGLAQRYAQEKAQTAVKRVAIPAAFGLIAAVFFVIVVIALFAALFYWLTSLYGPITAALIVAAVALVLGLMALLPIVVRRRPAPPPPAPNPPQFASLLAQTAPALALKRPLLAAFLLAVALGMMARGSSAGKK